MPSTSVRLFMVFAVNSPAQDPQLGHARNSIASISSAERSPDSNLPAASNIVLTLMLRPFQRPANIGPPLTTTVGIFSRPAAMSMPGTTLSQFGIMTRPSKACPLATASTESAISSRLARGYFIPPCPMAIPSQIAMAGNSTAIPPASAIPILTASAISLKCI